jgi:transcriptional regulator with XRE-family HTH domain
MPKTLRTPAHAALMQSLITHRKDRNITQQQLADRLNRPQSFVAKVETGERRIDAVELVEWSMGLGVDVAALLTPVATALRVQGPERT